MGLTRVGDIVKHTIGYHEGRLNQIYGKIIDIIDYNGRSHYEYKVITGRGDLLNSKVKIGIKPLNYCRDLSTCYLETLYLDPHKISLMDPTYEIGEINKEIDFLKKKIDFFNRNENRIDKLDKILEENENI